MVFAAIRELSRTTKIARGVPRTLPNWLLLRDL